MNSSQRIYVDVTVEFTESGRMLPKLLKWEDGREFLIDKVKEVRPAVAQKSGGQGDRYTVYICGKEKQLFFQVNPKMNASCVGRWFIEK